MCEKGGLNFNTTKDLSSHVSLIHRDPEVKCHFCIYCAMSRACMHHVCIHTKGDRYTLCKKSFPTVKALNWHLLLHKDRTQFECDSCDREFSTASSLPLHVCSKHGEGYICDKCQACFDTLVQQKRDLCKCK